MLYEYECKKGHITEAVRTVEERNNCPECEECGLPTSKIISHAHSQVKGNFDAFLSPAGTGRVIKTERDKIDEMKRTGCRQWEGLKEEKIEAARKRKYADEAFDKKVDKALQETVRALPDSSKRELGIN